MTLASVDTPSVIERVIRRDRYVMGGALAVITGLAWIYLWRSAAAMDAMSTEEQMHAAMGMVMIHAWGFSDWLALFVMWTVMMIGMMLPSAAPVILLVLAAYRRRNDRMAPVSSITFLTGYALAWTTFSLVASVGQITLHRTALMASEMRIAPAAVAGIVLLIVGAYQWLPFKNRCLSHCRSPLGILSHYWREGPLGGLHMGVRHGLFCVGCCWLLMAILFVVGVMNLLWVAALAALVVVEKIVSGGPLVGRIAGIAIAAWGVRLLAAAA